MSSALLILTLAVSPALSSEGPRLVETVEALDAACRDASSPIGLPLAAGGVDLVAASERSEGLEMRRPLVALDGRVRVHLATRPRLQYEGRGSARAAREALRARRASAVVVGRLDEGDALPACFGHPQGSFRSVTFHLEALEVKGADGSSLGRFTPAPREPPTTPGGAARIELSCGAGCGLSGRALTELLSPVKPRMLACAQGAPAGFVALELAREGSTSLHARGTVSSFEPAVAACVEAAAAELRVPRTAGTVLLRLEVAPAEAPGGPGTREA